MQKIKKLIVHYENGQVDEFVGDEGYLMTINTRVKDEAGTKQQTVRRVEASVTQFMNDWKPC